MAGLMQPFAGGRIVRADLLPAQSKEDWRVLDERLAALPYKCTIDRPQGDYEEVIDTRSNVCDLLQIGDVHQPVQIQRPIELRGRPDGSLLLNHQESEWSVNIRDIPIPLLSSRISRTISVFPNGPSTPALRFSRRHPPRDFFHFPHFSHLSALLVPALRRPRYLTEFLKT